jgi:hypothetical protein
MDGAAGDGTRTLDIQLGSNPLVVELGVPEKAYTSVRLEPLDSLPSGWSHWYSLGYASRR